MSKTFFTGYLLASLLMSGCGSSSVGAVPSVPSTTNTAAHRVSLQRIVDEGGEGTGADSQIPYRDTITIRQLLGHRGGRF